MKLSIIVTTILNMFATSPDLCAEPYLDPYGTPCTDSIGQTLSRYCKWTGPDAPVLDANVCCTIDGDGAACSMPNSRGSCSTGSKWYCEYGKKLTGGGVVCYQPFPSACDHGFCVAAPELPPPVLADLACCNAGMCQPIMAGQTWDCEGNGGTVLWCHDGMSNADGSITCFD
jgi:hypothetical protein